MNDNRPFLLRRGALVKFIGTCDKQKGSSRTQSILHILNDLSTEV